MAGSKKSSFILYADTGRLIDLLTDEDAGKLIKAVFLYVNAGVLPDRLSEKAVMAFVVIQGHIDRNTEKWEAERVKRAEAGRQGGIASGQARAKQKQANEASALQTKQTEAIEAVNVNASVNDNDSENGNDNEICGRVEGSGAQRDFAQLSPPEQEVEWNTKRNVAMQKLEKYNHEL